MPSRPPSLSILSFSYYIVSQEIQRQMIKILSHPENSTVSGTSNDKYNVTMFKAVIFHLLRGSVSVDVQHEKKKRRRRGWPSIGAVGAHPAFIHCMSGLSVRQHGCLGHPGIPYHFSWISVDCLWSSGRNFMMHWISGVPQNTRVAVGQLTPARENSANF